MTEISYEEILAKEAHRRALQNARAKRYYEAHKAEVLAKQKEFKKKNKVLVHKAKQSYIQHHPPPPPQEVEPPPPPIDEIHSPPKFTILKNPKTNKITYKLDFQTLKNLINELDNADMTKKRNINDARTLFRLVGTNTLNTILKQPTKLIKIIEDSKSQEGNNYSNNTKKV